MRTINTYPLPEGKAEAHSVYGNPFDAAWYATNISAVTLPYPLRFKGQTISTLLLHNAVHENLLVALQKLWDRTQSRLVLRDGSLKGQTLYDATIARLAARGLTRITETEGYASQLYVAFAFDSLNLPDDVVSLFESAGWIRHSNGQFQRVSAV